ncbi:NAD(P)/FAD-dependent oxidoreductase [Flexivirga oryzae]|uniref:NADPH-dependent 2,4-dienoyl-CoA reductase/sulfur reductase-like enzyme n=1 Tax=Flexivirga oryzae TaxID=1794944 RepID=A0A839NC30_9MICO|nr:FAD/NAD(P)-binding oxidoreductase [Flexivirga oryzae]MBB2893524.1 NADPH-dependent 2,4-dienoyl-CoA reductase/sulfur reductase-like enzyme [Flexivirga oryzae]
MAELDGKNYDYVIVGGGVAAAAAVGGIRELDETGSILVLGAEPDGPVYRPDLSKKLWLDKDASLDKAWLLDGQQVDLETSTPATAIDPDAHTVQVEGGATVSYGKLLLATGSSPRRLDLPDSDRIVYYRTAEDYRRLRELTGEDTPVTTIGGGYIGAEVTSVLTQNGVKVTMIFDETLVQQRLFPTSIAELITKDFTDRGVRLLTDETVSGGELADDRVGIRVGDGSLIEAGAVVVGVGVAPNVGLAEAVGITTDNGIVVDDRLLTSAPDVYAAGDVARYDDALLGRRRVEHVDNAEAMGKKAGRNMAGADEAYDYTPIVWSDLFDNGYEAVGDLDARLDTVEAWNDDHTAAVVYYLDGDTVRGVLLWNTWDSTGKARDVIAQSRDGKIGRDQLVGTIPPG